MKKDQTANLSIEELRAQNELLEQKILEIKKAESELISLKERYFAMYNLAKDAMVMMKGNAVEDCNESFLELFKCRKEDVVGLSPTDLSPEYQPDGVLSSEKELNIIRAALSGQPQVFEWEQKRLNGEKFFAEVSLTALDISGEQLLFAIIRDITDRKEEEKQRSESEERFKTLAQAPFEGIIFMADGIVLDVNDQITEMTGYNRKELIGAGVLDYIAPESRTLVIERLQNISDETIEIYVFKKDGSKMLVEARGKNIILHDKSVRVVAINDISSIRKTEEALKRAEFTIENFPDAVYWLDSEGNIVGINRTACKMLGYSEEELLGLKIFDFENKVDIEKWPKLWEQIKQSKSETMESVHIKKNGELIPVEITAHLITMGERELVSAFAKDISERIESQVALRNSEERLKLAIEGANVGIWDWPDINYPDQWWSDRIYKMLGSEPGKMDASFDRLREMVSDETLAKIESKLTEHFQTNKIFDVEFSARICDGTERWFKAGGKCYRNEDGIPLRMTGTMLDITDRKLNEDALKQNEEKLKAINQSKDRFFSILAHDLRSPFLSLTGFSDLLKNEHNVMTKEEIAEVSEKIYDVSQKSFVLLENVLSWARLQTGRLVPDFQPFNPFDIVANVISLQKDIANKKNIELINGITTGYSITADMNMMETIVRNLISNAVKFSNHFGKVEISEEVKEDIVVYSVKDSGIGMTKDIQEKLFLIDHKFTSIGTGGEEGTGLGLILCKEFVELHGGTIWLESSPGKGTSFYFSMKR